MREELDESARLAPVFAAERAEAIAWLLAQDGVGIAPAAADALADAFALRLVACAHTALDHERRSRTTVDATMTLDSRTTTTPDSRTTMTPDSRATMTPDSRATMTPDSRATTTVNARAAMTVDAFCVAIREPERWNAFLARYPVVARLLERSRVKWRETMRAFLDAIARDHEMLGATAELLDVRTRAGRLGARRATLIVTLGGGSRWVYRVYDRRMARWFVDVCSALAPHLSLPLHARTIHTRDGYSWDEFVVAGGCTTPDEVTRFFVRAGMLVRLSERLAATDFHCENVLAAGEYPVLVDVETLFSVTDAGTSPALSAFLLSPLRAGLLGPASYGDLGRPAVSKAGLHPGGRLVMPITVERLAPMDGPVGGFERVYPVETIAPTIPAPIGDHTADILAGYDEMERVLVAHPDLDGWLASAAELPVRSLGAGGRVHDHALHRGLAVELLEADAKRDAWLAGQSLSTMERDAIRELELPRAHTSVGAHPATLPQPPLTPAQLARRHDLIRTAIALGDDRPAVATHRPREAASFTAHAIAIGDALLAVRFGGGDWHGAVWVPWAGARLFDIVGPDLLSGRGGIALAFAYLFRVTSLPRFRDAALVALSDNSDLYSVLGGYVGLGASIYVRARCANLLREAQIADAARVDLAHLPASMVRDAPVDIATGLSGLVLASLALGDPPAHLVEQIATTTDRTHVLVGGVPGWVPPPRAACAIACARAGRNVSVTEVPLAWQPRPAPDAIASALAVPGDLLDDVDLALAGVRAAPRDPRFRAALVDRAERALERRERTGRWNPATSIAERHDLSVLTGVCAMLHALLAADAPDEVHSVRRLQ